MSEQAAEPVADNSGSLNVEGVSADSEVAAPAASARELASEFSFADADKVIGAAEAAATPAASANNEASAATPKVEIEAEPVKSEASGHDAAAVSGKVIVMPPRDRGFEPGAASGPQTAESLFGRRRISTLAAVVALAAAAGALGGAMATLAFTHDGGQALAAHDGQGALEAQLARIDADMQALKAEFEHTSKLGMSQLNKASDRLDRLERAQAEPARLAKLGEAIDKPHALPVPPPPVTASTAGAPKETTGSVPVPSAADAGPPATSTIAKVEPGRLPTLEGWVLRDVDRGSALIGNRRGVYEVYAGDFIPGLGRIDAIRRQDGRWVVVTSRGLIVAR
jgi:hypothetical protein